MAIKWVWVFCFSVFFLVIGMDIYLYNDDIERNAITQVVIDATKQSSLVPFFIGFFMGGLGIHFFDNHTQKKNRFKKDLEKWQKAKRESCLK